MEGPILMKVSENVSNYLNFLKLSKLCVDHSKEESTIFFKRLQDAKYYEFVNSENHNMIFGYILVEKLNEKVHLIDWVDTNLKKQNLCETMIECYERKFGVILLPYETIKQSAIYWLRYFYKNKCESFEDLSRVIKHLFDINTDNLKWKPLQLEYKLFNKFIQRNDVDHSLDLIKQYREFKRMMKNTLSV